jgi:hypothetical protein
VGDRRKVVDILAEVKLAGSGEPVLIHVEVQATPESGFARRMYTYYAGITQRHSHRVVPIAIYLFATKANEHPRTAMSVSDKCAADACQLESWVEYGVEIETLRFNFHAVHLRRVGWRELAGIGNPVALPVALALLGVAAGSLQDATERVQVAIAFYRGLVRTVNEPQDRQLLTAFFEAYMHLSGDERRRVRQVLESFDPKEAEAVEQIWTPLHEMGRAEGYVEVVLRQFRKRLGQVPADVESSVRALPPTKVLDLADALFEIDSTEHLRAWLATNGEAVRNS